MMEYTWSEAKRKSNLKNHGFDFADAFKVFDAMTFTFEDARFGYDEQRFVTLGQLNGQLVSIVHTETEDTIRVISFRKATHREADLYYTETQY
jgi:uncharacterized protein